MFNDQVIDKMSESGMTFDFELDLPYESCSRFLL